MVLKRCVYGVDKNLMAVELAKVALWLHTFTVGAPLQLPRPPSAHAAIACSGRGCARDRPGRGAGGELFLHGPLAADASRGSHADHRGLTDAEIAEAHRSAAHFQMMSGDDGATGCVSVASFMPSSGSTLQTGGQGGGSWPSSMDDLATRSRSRWGPPGDEAATGGEPVH